MILPMLLTSALLMVGERVKGGKVLVYIPVAGASSLELYRPLAVELATKGHQVTWVTSLQQPQSRGVKQIVVNTPSFSSLFQDDLFVLFVSDSPLWQKLQTLVKFYNSLIQVHEDALNDYDLWSRLHCQSEDCKFDLIITSPLFNEIGVMLGDYLSIPTILFLPVNGESLLSMSLGYPDKLSWCGQGAVSTLSGFSAHISNLVYQMVIKPLLFVQPQLRTIQAMFPNYTLADYDSLERNADAGFYSTSPLLGQVMPRLPNTVNVGFIHCRPGKGLSAEMSKWLEADARPVIYMSMGSIYQVPEAVLNIFTQVFEKLPLRVIWKRKDKLITNKFYQAPWIPQQDLLASGHVRLFVSQLGMVSLQEAVYHGVPILGLPLTYEQGLNSDIVTMKNIGRVLQISGLTADILLAEISEMLSSGNYTEEVQSLSRMVKDHRRSPLEEAVWWSEHTMAHKGCDHYKSPYRHSADLVKNNILYSVMEVIAFTLILCYILVSVVRKRYSFR